jgi:hypothetical protein
MWARTRIFDLVHGAAPALLPLLIRWSPGGAIEVP